MELTRINRGTGRNRDALLRQMYGLDIPDGNCAGPTFAKSGRTVEQHQRWMRSEAERAKRSTLAHGGINRRVG